MMKKDFNYYDMLIDNKDISIHQLTDGLAVAYRYRPREIYFINENEKKAWLVLDSSDRLLQWELKDVDFEKLTGMDHVGNARAMQAPYGFNIQSFGGCRALVSWTLHPDGGYFADEDGYGMTDDEEEKVYGVINGQCEVIIPFQPMNKDDFQNWKSSQFKRTMVVLTGMGIHGDEEKFIHDKSYPFVPGKAHQMIAAFEKDYKVTVITTCPDTCHEQAGSTSVIHLLDEAPPKELLGQAVETVRTADICILVGCRCTVQPLRNIMQYVKASSRLYLCYYNSGEGRMPRMHNLVRAFAVGTFSTPEEGIETVNRHLETFPLE